jgi:hypothetical protein
MKTGKASWKTGLAAVLISSTVALTPLSDVAAQQRYNEQPPPTPAPRYQEDAARAAKRREELAGKMFLCAMLGCFGPPARVSQGSASPMPGTHSQAQRHEKPYVDTSIGCAWGDTATGTCR